MSNTNPVGFILNENMDIYNFGEGHPLSPIRIELTYELMKAYGLFEHENIKLLTPQPATEEQVLRVHSEGYVNKLKELTKIENPGYMAEMDYGLGPGDNPIFPGMYEDSLLMAGTTVSAANYLLAINEDTGKENTRAHNLLGGLHHALPSRASGFCILNDLAIAIEHIKQQKPDARIIYLDIDCHHGDGVQWIYYDRNDVLTLSFHEYSDHFFPGSGGLEENGKGDGVGYALNVPCKVNTPSDIYLDVFRRIFPEVVKAYNPDFIIAQTGVDTHFTDPLTSMGLSTTAHEKIFEIIMDTTEKYSADKLLVVGGGGYNMNVVARSWTLFLAKLLGAQIDEPLPQSWLDYLNSKWDELPPPELLRDRNWILENKKLKDPYMFDELDIHYNKIIDKFTNEYIPNLNSTNSNN